MKVYQVTWLSPLGGLHLMANDQELLSLCFDENRDACLSRLGMNEVTERENRVIERVQSELEEYFAGKRRAFTVPINLQGTAFQKRAWEALRRIPFGATISYGEQARALGAAAAVRATGTANGRNPIAIIVPCHRVVRSDGTLGGYAGGMDLKASLLELEARYGAPGFP
jgi:methylated-DNA-[protein]-cysteine S-methyltransferase